MSFCLCAKAVNRVWRQISIWLGACLTLSTCCMWSWCSASTMRSTYHFRTLIRSLKKKTHTHTHQRLSLAVSPFSLELAKKNYNRWGNSVFENCNAPSYDVQIDFTRRYNTYFINRAQLNVTVRRNDLQRTKKKDWCWNKCLPSFVLSVSLRFWVVSNQTD